ncbi:MAG: ATP-binding cassette domain-containing protein [Gemmatimonas sp.]
MTTRALLAADKVTKRFRATGPGAQTVTALDGVSLELRHGETLAVVGESGSGKSTLARIMLDLLRPDDGRVLFDGKDVASLRGRDRMQFRRAAQIVFQDPFSSLNPRLSVGTIVGEPLAIHSIGDRAERRRRVAAALEAVGLSASDAARAPHAFSGGQRQRIAIARALILEPQAVLLDEPLSALDVTIQRQILTLLAEIKQRRKLTYLFITHDLGVARAIADRIAVMHRGRIVELGPTESVFTAPEQRYTRELIAAVPVLGGPLRIGAPQ